MSEMIERAARKLEPQAWAALGIGDTLAYSNRRTSSLRKARAVIEGMREPTREMIAAANRNNHPRDIDTWQTMIDAALTAASSNTDHPAQPISVPDQSSRIEPT